MKEMNLGELPPGEDHLLSVQIVQSEGAMPDNNRFWKARPLRLFFSSDSTLSIAPPPQKKPR